MEEANGQSISVCVAQLGARRHYIIPLLLEKAGMLEKFYTDGYAVGRPFFGRIARVLKLFGFPKIASRLISRGHTGIPFSRVRSFDGLGLRHAIARRLVKDTAARTRNFCHFSSIFNHRVIAAGYGEASIIYGFNGASLELFQHAKTLGKICYLDQTMAARSVMARELSEAVTNFPNWQPNLSLPKGNDMRSGREKLEWALADRILCPSHFVMDSIARAGGPLEKCVLVPFGTDAQIRVHRQRYRKPDSPLRILFVGEVGIRKGVPYLLKALAKLSLPYECKIVGPIELDSAILEKYDDLASFVGAVPRSEVQSFYDWADLFVLPSLFEGSAGVNLEALASGLPVIATPNSGAPSVKGVKFVKARSVIELSEAIHQVDKEYESFRPDMFTLREISVENYQRKIISLINRDISLWV